MLNTKEKGLESFINAAQGILQHLTINSRHVWSNFFDAPKLIRLRYVADTLTVRRPSISTLLQGSVVQFTAHVQRGLQLFLLLAIRIQAIFERQP